jgi:hypothetical protein
MHSWIFPLPSIVTDTLPQNRNIISPVKSNDLEQHHEPNFHSNTLNTWLIKSNDSTPKHVVVHTSDMAILSPNPLPKLSIQWNYQESTLDSELITSEG